MGALPDVGAIVHTHSRYAAAFAVARLDLPFICNESLASRAERVLVTDYAPPGSTDLAEQALRTLRAQPGSRAVLLANHGVVAIAPELGDAYVVALSVEWTAEICHHARTLLGAGAGEHVLDHAVQEAIARNYGVTIGRPKPTR
jgi:L-fuculose-phosphate aldolase